MRDLWPPRELPDIPPELKDAALDGSLVMFIGAGVSRLAGGLSWDDFAARVLRSLADRRDRIIITFGDIQQLSHLDAKKQLTIASQIAQAEDLNIDYKPLLQVSEKKSDIYNHINQIGCVYVTTNYDTFLQPRLPAVGNGSVSSRRAGGGPICRPQQFLAGILREPGTVVHLHGCVDEPDSMIITTTDYLRHYDNNYVQEFLSALFEKHTVLFVGYGLEEYEILEHMLRKGESRSRRQERKRFILQGFYPHQQNIHRHLFDYFKKCFGLYLISFNMDYEEHRQLEYIMKDWAPRLEVRKPALADDLRFIEEVASE